MRKSLFIVAAAVLLVSFTSCKKCKGEDPSVVIINNGSESTSVQIQTSGGNTVNVNNILSGQQSEEESFAPGTVDFNISIGNNSPILETVEMQECWTYEVIVNADNSVSTTAFDKNE